MDVLQTVMIIVFPMKKYGYESFSKLGQIYFETAVLWLVILFCKQCFHVPLDFQKGNLKIDCPTLMVLFSPECKSFNILDCDVYS